MDYKEITFTKEQQDKREKEMEALKQMEKNVVKVFTMLREKHRITLSSAGSHSTPYREHDIFAKEVKDIYVSRDNFQEGITIKFIY